MLSGQLVVRVLGSVQCAQCACTGVLVGIWTRVPFGPGPLAQAAGPFRPYAHGHGRFCLADLDPEKPPTSLVGVRSLSAREGRLGCVATGPLGTEHRRSGEVSLTMSSPEPPDTTAPSTAASMASDGHSTGARPVESMPARLEAADACWRACARLRTRRAAIADTDCRSRGGAEPPR